MPQLLVLLLTLFGGASPLQTAQQPKESRHFLEKHQSSFRVHLVRREITRTMGGEEEVLQRELPSWVWQRSRELTLEALPDSPMLRIVRAEQSDVRQTRRADSEVLEQAERACFDADPNEEAVRLPADWAGSSPAYALAGLAEGESVRLSFKSVAPLLFPGKAWGLVPCRSSEELDSQKPLSRSLRKADERAQEAKRKLRGELEVRRVPAPEGVLYQLQGTVRFSQGEREALQLPGDGSGFESQRELHRIELQGILQHPVGEPGEATLQLQGRLWLERRDVRTLASERGDVETDRRYHFEGRYRLESTWGTR